MLLKIYGCMMDDLDELVKAGFLIRFESGIYLVRHWLVNNQIQRDRYHETIFLAEKAMVRVDKSRVYNLETSCIHSVSNLETESSLSSQDELEKRNIYNGGGAAPPFYNGRSAPESEVREKEAEWNRMRNERMREVNNAKF
jgi:hypothetical protein